MYALTIPRVVNEINMFINPDTALQLYITEHIQIPNMEGNVI